MKGVMKRAPFALLAFVAIAQTFGKEPAATVTFVSPCECIAFHGINRWVAKTDLSPVPSDKSAIQAVTPSQIYAWEGLGAGCGHKRLHRSEDAIRSKMERSYRSHR